MNFCIQKRTLLQRGTNSLHNLHEKRIQTESEALLRKIKHS